jgi:hypothetical protein
VVTFDKLPLFNELIARVRAVMNVGSELWLHGRYNGKKLYRTRVLYNFVGPCSSFATWT